MISRFSLQQYRRESRMSQRALSELTGVSRNVIANVESGRQTVLGDPELRCIARVLDVHPAAIDPTYDPERALVIAKAKAAAGRALKAVDEALGRAVG